MNDDVKYMLYMLNPDNRISDKLDHIPGHKPGNIPDKTI